MQRLQGRIAASPGFKSIAWLAVFALQIGMFGCLAGVDICHAGTTQSIETHADSQPANDMPDAGDDTPCMAHATHVFVATHAASTAKATGSHAVDGFHPLPVPHELLTRIEQPPKPLAG